MNECVDLWIALSLNLITFLIGFTAAWSIYRKENKRYKKDCEFWKEHALEAVDRFEKYLQAVEGRDS